MPVVRPLALVLKYFLQQRGLHEPYLGGIGSYSCVLMIISFLQQRQMNVDGQQQQLRDALQHDDLGLLLTEFFEFYGTKFNYFTTGLSIRDGGCYFQKEARGWLNSQRQFLLSCEDPQDEENDVSKNSFNVMQVRSAFAHAFYVLSANSAPWAMTQLQRVINVDPKLTEFRRHLQHVYRQHVSATLPAALPLASDRYASLSSPQPPPLEHYNEDDDDGVQRRRQQHQQGSSSRRAHRSQAQPAHQQQHQRRSVSSPPTHYQPPPPPQQHRPSPLAGYARAPQHYHDHHQQHHHQQQHQQHGRPHFQQHHHHQQQHHHHQQVQQHHQQYHHQQHHHQQSHHRPDQNWLRLRVNDSTPPAFARRTRYDGNGYL
eukprot:TRINITY_DN530_c0_g3_i1.p1 TRINITY_DN530_c0_g3~~TRINITY_DN530_c0_g3_i1.p1  ORF type:complete len:371 (+),score=134.36 TRINITY_DN530_c0_g3_i1:591-1703(+)